MRKGRAGRANHLPSAPGKQAATACRPSQDPEGDFPRFAVELTLDGKFAAELSLDGKSWLIGLRTTVAAAFPLPAAPEQPCRPPRALLRGSMDIDELLGILPDSDVECSPVPAKQPHPGSHAFAVLSTAREAQGESAARLIFGDYSAPSSAAKSVYRASPSHPQVFDDSGAEGLSSPLHPCALQGSLQTLATVNAVKHVLQAVEDEEEDDELKSSSSAGFNSAESEEESGSSSDDASGGASRAATAPPQRNSSCRDLISKKCSKPAGNAAVVSSGKDDALYAVPAAAKSGSQSCALVPAAASSDTRITPSTTLASGPISAQSSSHMKGAKSCFNGWECHCPIAAARQETSCLASINTSTLKQISAVTYESLKITDIKKTVHTRIWHLKEPLDTPDAHNRIYKVPCWKLEGRIVCKAAFMVAVGGTKHAHREGLTLTLLGQPPEGYAAGRRAIKAARKLAAADGSVRNARRDWAICWWKRHLMWHDWLPNEVAIQYRGPTWTLVHKQYQDEARVLSTSKVALKGRAWMIARKPALKQLHQQFFANVTHTSLTCVRSARHSHFPECTMCQQLRGTYFNLARSIGSSKEALSDAYDALIEHTRDWQKDREKALDLRYIASHYRSNCRYQCDDKCGSFWQKLPVNASGRDTKDDTAARYAFSIHANVCCGDNGVIRFTCVPKNVACGADFGITHFLLTLLSAKRNGHFPEHVTHMIRHTDGGSDNVAIIVHFIHWLLIYLGVFDELTWFRFMAGHSHTEIADRLFSILKRFFKSDSQARVLGIQDIPELIHLLEVEFGDEKENFQFVFDFAHWDFSTWAEDQKLLGPLAHTKNVRCWRYWYDVSNWKHGCVTVQRKEKISFQGNIREAEWSPIEQVTKMLPNTAGDMEETTVNVSKPCGHMFVCKPPDLRVEPRREDFVEEKADTPYKVITRLLKVRLSDLTRTAVSFWTMLQSLHFRGRDPQSLPDMPFSAQSDDGTSFTFTGSPCSFKSTMKELAFRCPRPLVSSDPFSNAPHDSFEAAFQASKSLIEEDRPKDKEFGPVPMAPLRDPRVENDVVDLNHSEAERRRDLAAVDREQFALEQDNRVDSVCIGELYMLELEKPEHNIKLGLGMVLERNERENKWIVAWFLLASAKCWATQNPGFIVYYKRGALQQQEFSIECFRLHVSFGLTHPSVGKRS